VESSKDNSLVKVEAGAEHLASERDALLVIAERFADIKTQEDYERAAAFVRIRCKGVIDDIMDFTFKSVKSANDAHKEALKIRRALLGDLPEAMQVVESGMVLFLRNEEASRKQLEASMSEVAGEAITLPTPKAEGVSTRRRWKAEVYDVAALVRYAFKTPGYFGAIGANQDWLDDYAAINKGGSEIPGVRFEEVISIVKKKG
jgi:hypothetical protein